MKKQVTLEDLIKKGKITNITIDRVEVAKSYIEKKYSLRKQQNEEKQKGKKKYINNSITNRLGVNS
jgi:hypothetical protein